MSYNSSSSLSDFLHSVWQSLGPSMLLQMVWFHSINGWVIFHCINVPHLLYPFFWQWAFWSLLCYLFCCWVSAAALGIFLRHTGFSPPVVHRLWSALAEQSCAMWALSSPTRDWTHIPCIGRWSLRPPGKFLKVFFISTCCHYTFNLCVALSSFLMFQDFFFYHFLSV